MTFFTLVAGSFVTNYEAEPIEDFNYQDLNFHHFKYTPFRAWKWYIFLFETSLIYEIIITIIFWSLLFPAKLDEWNGLVPDKKIPSDLSKLSTVLDHSAPLGLLLFDFMYNAVPIAKRHFVFIFLISICYLIVNFAVTKITGDAPYGKFLNWSDAL